MTISKESSHNESTDLKQYRTFVSSVQNQARSVCVGGVSRVVPPFFCPCWGNTPSLYGARKLNTGANVEILLICLREVQDAVRKASQAYRDCAVVQQFSSLTVVVNDLLGIFSSLSVNGQHRVVIAHTRVCSKAAPASNVQPETRAASPGRCKSTQAASTSPSEPPAPFRLPTCVLPTCVQPPRRVDSATLSPLCDYIVSIPP